MIVFCFQKFRLTTGKAVVNNLQTDQLKNAIVYPKPKNIFNWKEFDHEAYLKKGALKPGEDR